MKKGIFYRIKGPQLFMSLIFVCLGLIMLVLSVRGYKEHSQKDIVALDSASISETRVTRDELRSMFEFTRGSGGDHELIVQKNLFTPDREAWQPPPPRDEEEKETVSASRLNPGDFKLYGITLSGSEKKALVYCQNLPDRNKHRLVSEGETVEHEEREIFTVASIDGDSVTLELGGESLRIGLYDHERRSVDVASQSGRSIVIGGKDETTKVASRDRQEAEEEDSQASSQRADEPELPADTASGVPDDDRDMERRVEEPEDDRDMERRVEEPEDDRDMERRVEEGELRRIDTPFGTIYRPVRENGE